MNNIIKRIPNLRHLRAFMVIVEYESITSASNVLHISQPAISKAISNLEVLTRTVLFTRSPEGTYATDEGKRFYSKIKLAFEHLEKGFVEAISAEHNGHHVKRLLHITTSNQLKAFMTVASVNSFSDAAVSLGVPASAIHRSVREFEENLELKLFQRKGKRIESTLAAERLNLSVTCAFREIAEGLSEINPKSNDEEINLSIGCVSNSDNSTLLHYIYKFASQASNCRVSIKEGTLREQLQSLRSGDVDIVIGHVSPEDTLRGIVSRTSRFSDPLVVAVSAAHALADENKISCDKLASFPWVIVPNCSSRNENRPEFWKYVGLTPERTIEANSLELALELVDSSDSLGVFPLSRVQKLFDSGRLKPLPLELEEDRFSTSILTRRSWQPNAMQMSFVESISK